MKIEKINEHIKRRIGLDDEKNNAMLNMVDSIDGEIIIDEDEKEMLNDFLNKANDLRAKTYLNNYYLVERDESIKDDFFSDIRYIYDNKIGETICDEIMRVANSFDNDKCLDAMRTLIKLFNVKGYRDEQSDRKTISMFLDLVTSNPDAKSNAMERITEKANKYIIYIGNDSRALLTSSYSDYFGSCFRFNTDTRFDYKGCYRASNLTWISDSRSLIIKAFEYNDDNLALAKSDDLKYSDKTISRKFALNINRDIVINKTYGDKTLNNISLVKNICETCFSLKHYTKKIDFNFDANFYDGIAYNNLHEVKYILSINENRYDYIVDGFGDMHELVKDYQAFNDEDNRIISSYNEHDGQVYSEFYDDWIDEDEATYCDNIRDYINENDDCLFYDDGADRYFYGDGYNYSRSYVVVDGEYYCFDYHDINVYE